MTSGPMAYPTTKTESTKEPSAELVDLKSSRICGIPGAKMDDARELSMDFSV